MSESSSQDTVLSRLEGGVLTITFNRPGKKNAFTHGMYEAVTAQLAAAQVDDAVRAVVLTGTEGCFTAGNDIGDFMQHPPAGEDSAVFRFLRVLSGLDTPVLAAVDGPAVGIGTTMLLHCDYVVAADRTRFAMPFVNLGLCPEGGSTVLLPFIAGHALASELLMFGEPFDAATALRAGLINRVAPPEEVLGTSPSTSSGW
jgi:enoyl-CoA hydratase/carnithine racemase